MVVDTCSGLPTIVHEFKQAFCETFVLQHEDDKCSNGWPYLSIGEIYQKLNESTGWKHPDDTKVGGKSKGGLWIKELLTDNNCKKYTKGSGHNPNYYYYVLEKSRFMDVPIDLQHLRRDPTSVQVHTYNACRAQVEYNRLNEENDKLEHKKFELEMELEAEQARAEAEKARAEAAEARAEAAEKARDAAEAAALSQMPDGPQLVQVYSAAKKRAADFEESAKAAKARVESCEEAATAAEARVEEAKKEEEEAKARVEEAKARVEEEEAKAAEARAKAARVVRMKAMKDRNKFAF